MRWNHIQVDEIVWVNLLENFINVLYISSKVTERSHIARKRFTGKYAMNGSILIQQLSLRWTQLFYFNHLCHLSVANKYFVHFKYLLFENKEYLAIHHINHVWTYKRFPNPFIKIPLNSFSCILVETLEVSFVDIESFASDTTISQICLNLSSNVLPIWYFLSFLLTILEEMVIVQITSQQILIWQEERVLWTKMTVFWNQKDLLLKF